MPSTAAEGGPVERRISLVVPMRNEEASIGALLESILAQTVLPDEVILVDGGSADRTVERARALTVDDPRFWIIEAGEATPGRGRNVGIAAARNDWIALTDAGIRLEPTWLEKLSRAVEQEPGLDVVYGSYEPVLNSSFEHCAALAYVPPKQPRGGGCVRGPSTASCMIRRAVWEGIGGFPDARAGEDLVAFDRIEAGGFRIGWQPGAVAWWQIQPDFARTFRRFALYSKHIAWLGRQRTWQYGVARQYAAGVLALALAALHSPWWAALLPAGYAARVLKGIWRRREGRPLGWVLNPTQALGVAAVLLVIDAATFYGWFRAWTDRPRRRHADGVPVS